MRIRARRIGTISAAAALLFSTACGSSEQAPDALDKFYRQSPQWVSCAEFQGADEIAGAGYQCAYVEVPLDYAEPTGATARIAISRRPADGERIGALLTNPGGPGAPGLTYPAVFAKTPLAQRFDLIGVDVRGLGASMPKVTCLTEEEFQAQRSDLDLDFSPSGIAQTEQEHRDYIAKCVERTGLDVLTHVGTADVARDFDVIRAVLGDPKLTYFGGSYGTRLGSTMAELFPQRIRAMVLDGGVDPATNMIDQVTFSAGFQHAFEAFAAACVTTPTCPIGVDPDPARVRISLRALVDPLIERPATTSDQRGLGYNDALAGIVNSLYTPETWPQLTRGLTELTQGRGDTLLAVADFFARPGTVARGLHNAVLCLEEIRVTDRAAAAELDRRMRAAAPIFDDGRASGQAPLDLCAFWPVPPATQPHVPNVTGLPPVLVVAATGDPATPYPGGVALARALQAPLITYEGVQHGAFGSGVACVDEPVLRYLIDLAPPPGEVRCAHVG